VKRLKSLLDERDKQLNAQASSLQEMESSLAEIQNLMPDDGMDFGRTIRSNGNEPSDVGQLRALLREKNEKIAMLTAEFDNHRADFRSTIDTLEMASTETERVYERKVEELQTEIRELHDRSEDVESVANQLKQLEELVQELEEGLEDARRGEAEARGEVEFLRGEVERGRSELRREREKAAAALKGAGAMVDGPLSPGSREVEQRDDEIRGLKAIIHSLSSGPEEHGRSPLQRLNSSVNPEEFRAAQATADRLEREKEELRGLVERKAFREEELEREIEKLRAQVGAVEQRESVISNSMSERTATQDKRSSGRDSKGTVVSWRGSPQAKRHEPPSKPLEPMMESDGVSSADGSVLWCEICETGGHDILNCSAMSGGDNKATQSPSKQRNGKETVIEGLRNLSVSSDRPLANTRTPTKSPGNAPTAPLPTPINLNSNLVPPKGATVADPDKWCALCESEGHDVTACPNEDAF
jgi:chromosome segregation ATPase